MSESKHWNQLIVDETTGRNMLVLTTLVDGIEVKDEENEEPFYKDDLVDGVVPVLTREQIRHQMSALLEGFDEDNPLLMEVPLEHLPESFGISSLLSPRVMGAFMQPGEGIIWFNVFGMEEPVEFDDIPVEDLREILDAMEN